MPNKDALLYVFHCFWKLVIKVSLESKNKQRLMGKISCKHRTWHCYCFTAAYGDRLQGSLRVDGKFELSIDSCHSSRKEGRILHFIQRPKQWNRTAEIVLWNCPVAWGPPIIIHAQCSTPYCELRVCDFTPSWLCLGNLNSIFPT